MQKEFKSLIKSLEKDYGEEVIMRLGDDVEPNIDTISTGSMLLDEAIGIGGLPKGRIIEIYGPESSGKTTLALHAVREVQKAGGQAAFIDAENAIDLSYAQGIGVDVNNLLLSQPDSGEQALGIVEKLVNSGMIDIIVVDSVAALVPEVELMGEMSDQTIGAQARLMSKGLRKMAKAINQNNVIVIFINQLREKVGVIYGNPETTSGGKALKFYSTLRFDIRRSEYIKKDGENIGIRSKVKIVKNKVAPPFKVVSLDIYYGTGISKVGELVDLASENGVIKKSGAWYYYEEEKLAQGRDNVINLLCENEALFAKIEDQYLESVA